MSPRKLHNYAMKESPLKLKLLMVLSTDKHIFAFCKNNYRKPFSGGERGESRYSLSPAELAPLSATNIKHYFKNKLKINININQKSFAIALSLRVGGFGEQGTFAYLLRLYSRSFKKLAEFGGGS